MKGIKIRIDVIMVLRTYVTIMEIEEIIIIIINMIIIIIIIEIIIIQDIVEGIITLHHRKSILKPNEHLFRKLPKKEQ